jgi:cysteinyl-tRNA synthetase
MAGKYLGPAFDIHGGGLDLRFPHHENEQAQARAAGRPFATYWMHNAWITTAGEKMSKSLGNSLTIPAVLERFRGIELRYYLVSAHYRSHVEFSFEALEEAAVGFRRIEGFLERTRGLLGPELHAGFSDGDLAAFSAAMDDDLGTPAAVAAIHDRVRQGNKELAEGDHAALATSYAVVWRMLDILGLAPSDPAWSTGGSVDDKATLAVGALVAGLLEQRAAARAAKDWARADEIRDQLKSAGIELEDTPEGPKWSIG